MHICRNGPPEGSVEPILEADRGSRSLWRVPGPRHQLSSRTNSRTALRTWERWHTRGRQDAGGPTGGSLRADARPLAGSLGWSASWRAVQSPWTGQEARPAERDHTCIYLAYLK